MTDISLFVKRLYMALIGLGILSAILPMFFAREYAEDGSITSSTPEIMILSSWGLVILILMIIYFVLIGLSYLTLKSDFFDRYRFVSWFPRRTMLIISYLWTVFMLYGIDIGTRLPRIQAAYSASNAFGNVVAPGPGYYALLLLITLNLALIFIDHEKDWGSMKEKLRSYLQKMQRLPRNPVIIQYTVFHITMLLYMMISYSIYFSDIAFWNGIDYYSDLFYSYGLNRRVGDIPWYYTIFSLFLLPFAMIAFSSYFLSSKGAGFAPNGASLETSVPENSYINEAVNFSEWAFFSMDVPFAEVWVINPKINLFYISLLLTAFLSFIVGALVARKLSDPDQKSSYYLLLFIFSVISWLFAYSFSVLSAPIFILWGGIVESTFFERNINRFIIYRFVQVDSPDSGLYHPLTIFWVLFIFAIAIAASSVIFLKLFEKKKKKGVKGIN